MSSIRLFDVQMGKESAFGTPVVMTKILQGVETIELTAMRERQVHEYQDGTLAPSSDTFIGSKQGAATIDTFASYEMLPYLLNLVFDAVNSPTGTDPYTYDYAAPIAAGESPSNDYFTILYSDGTDEQAIVSAYATTFTLTGEKGEPAKASIELAGYDIVESVTRVALSEIAITPIATHNFALYIDAAGGTVGTTLVSGEILSFELVISPGGENVFAADSLNPQRPSRPKMGGTLSLTMFLDTNVRTRLTNILADSGDSLLVRLIATEGTNAARFDFCGHQMGDISLWGDDTDEAVLEFELSRLVDTGAFANWFKAQIINGIASPF